MASRRTRDGGMASAAQTQAEAPERFAVSDFLLSMVESLWACSGNGSGLKMDAALKAQQELEKVEQQIAQRESIAGARTASHKQLEELRPPADTLRKPNNGNLNA